MSRVYQAVLFTFIAYLLWRCHYTQRLLIMCEDFQRIQPRIHDLVHAFKTVEMPPKSPVGMNRCAANKAADCVPPLYPFKPRGKIYRVAHKYQLIGCAIEKNFSTMLSAIFCYLFDEDEFLQKNRSFSSETYHRRFCSSRNEFESLSEVEGKFVINGSWTKLAVVRDPLEKLVSGFVDKCLREKTWKKFPDRCNRCKTNLQCFMERQYARMRRRSSGVKQPASFDDDHFFPQNWRCEFSAHLHEFKVLHFDSFKPSTFLEELLAVLRKSKVGGKSIEFISQFQCF